MEFFEPPKRLKTEEDINIVPQAIVSASPNYRPSVIDSKLVKKGKPGGNGLMNKSTIEMEEVDPDNNDEAPTSTVKVEGSLEKLLNAGRVKASADDLAGSKKGGKLVVPRKGNPIAPTKAIYCVGDS